MALQVWLPLNGNLENKGASGLSFSMYSESNFTLADGKIGKAYKHTSSNIGYIRSDLPINLGNKLSMFCWVNPTVFNADSNLTGVFGQHRYMTNTGMGVNLARASETTGYLSLSTGDGTNRTYVTYKGKTLLSANKWYHVGFTYDGNKIKLYVNGVLDAEVDYTVQKNVSDYIVLYSWSLASTSGNAAYDNYELQGQLNDVRIYDECLSPKQIKQLSKCLLAHYSLEGPGGHENFILTSDRVISGSQASGITRTYESDGSMKIVSTSGNGNYCSIGFAQNSNTNVGAKMVTGDTFSVSCDIKVEEGTAFPTMFINEGNNYKALLGDITKIGEWQRVYYTSTWGTPGTQYGNISLHLGFSGAIGTYYFKNFKLEKGSPTAWTPAPSDENYTALGYKDSWGYDLSGNGYNANIVGEFTFSTDSPHYQGSAQFYGDGYLNNIPSPITSSTDSFTFTCWYYPTANTTGALYNNRTGVGNGIAVFHIGSNIRFDTSDVSQFTAGTLTLNKWHFIGCIYDKTNNIKKIYINGNQVGETATIGNLNTVGTIASIGASSTNDAGGGNTVSGSISDVRIYGTALTDSDLKDLYSKAGYVDNYNNWHFYSLTEFSYNKFEDANNSVCDKQWTNGLWYYNQANCQVSMTDDGIRIYRPPNLVHDSSTMHNMWGGFRISPMTVNTNSLQKGHTYIILVDVKGKTSNAANSAWDNQMGWGGGGLTPQPSNVERNWIPANWQSDEYVTFFYKWTIEDDVYKTCTSSYSSFVAGQEYISYRDFCLNFNYQNTGELGTDIYVRNLRCYDITNLGNATIAQTGTVLAAALQETNQLARIHLSGEIGGSEYIEI